MSHRRESAFDDGEQRVTVRVVLPGRLRAGAADERDLLPVKVGVADLAALGPIYGNLEMYCYQTW
jgi:hypothetical protein